MWQRFPQVVLDSLFSYDPESDRTVSIYAAGSGWKGAVMARGNLCPPLQSTLNPCNPIFLDQIYLPIWVTGSYFHLKLWSAWWQCHYSFFWSYNSSWRSQSAFRLMCCNGFYFRSLQQLPAEEIREQFKKERLPGELGDFTGAVMYPDEVTSKWDEEGNLLAANSWAFKIFLLRYR